MFSRADSAAIGEKYVAVRILGGGDLTDDGRAFMRRHRIGAYPVLLAMTHDGAVLERTFAWSVDGILKGMADAAKRQAAFEAEVAERLKHPPDEADQRILAGLHRSREEYEKARAYYETLTEASPQLEDQLALLDVLGRLDEKESRRALLASLIATHTSHADRIHWRIELATMDVPTTFTSRDGMVAALKKQRAVLTGLLATVEKPAEQAVVRVHLARILNSTRDREAALEHWNWVLENARDSAVAADALMGKAGALWLASFGDVAKLVEIKAMLEEVVEKHPRHPRAREAARGIPQLERAIEKAKADAEAAGKASPPPGAPKKDDG